MIKPERLHMFKKQFLFLFLIGVLLLSACSSQTPEPTGTTAPEATAAQTEETSQEPTQPEDVFEGDRMPCSTVYDYETTAETDQYQAVVDQLPPLDLENDWVRGNPDAPITIFEYADLQCPACVGFAQYTKLLLDFFPDSIKVVFRHLPLPSIHDKAYLGGMAVEAAGAQGMFWEMHDYLYENQSDWNSLTPDDFIDWVVNIAGTMGMDTEQFRADLTNEDDRAALEELTDYRLNLGMNYTPFVVVNDRIFRENKPDLFGLIGIYEYGGYDQCPPWVIDPDKSYTAVLNTSVGEIKIDLFADVAPLAVNSFVFLSQEGWYDNVYFHRVVEDFVAQAGDPSGLGAVNPGYTFANETDNDLSFDSAGVLGMANAGVDTNGSQFFITLGPATDLDGSYTIFGKVQEESMPVLDQIALRDPNTAVDFEGATVINSIDIIEN
jgi:cyclophilin family peptidyl-prolyl cis-trans isomerase/protein-disulfide isomerase